MGSEKMRTVDYLKMVNGIKSPGKAIQAIRERKPPKPKAKYNEGNYTGELLDAVMVKAEGARVDYMNDHILVVDKYGKKFRIIIQAEQ